MYKANFGETWNLVTITCNDSDEIITVECGQDDEWIIPPEINCVRHKIGIFVTSSTL